jgi:hypothetical protein
MSPVVAPEGTGTVMLESLQVVGVPATPLKVTVLLPYVAPKPEPLMVTEVPTGPPVGATPEIDCAMTNAGARRTERTRPKGRRR